MNDDLHLVIVYSSYFITYFITHVALLFMFTENNFLATRLSSYPPLIEHYRGRTLVTTLK